MVGIHGQWLQSTVDPKATRKDWRRIVKSVAMIPSAVGSMFPGHLLKSLMIEKSTTTTTEEGMTEIAL